MAENAEGPTTEKVFFCLGGNATKSPLEGEQRDQPSPMIQRVFRTHIKPIMYSPYPRATIE